MTAWQLLHKWYMPFVAFAVCAAGSAAWAVHLETQLQPVAGVEIGLTYGQAWLPRDSLIASMTPYLLTAVPFAWLFSTSSRTRWTAFWAGAVGVLRIALPIMVLAMTDVAVPGSSQRYVDWFSVRIMIWFADAEVITLGLLLWSAFGTFAKNAPKRLPRPLPSWEGV